MLISASEAAARTGPPTIDPKACTGCTQCVLLCPVDAISRQGLKCVIDPSTCTKCGRCADVCPNAALRTQDRLPS